MLLNLLSIAVGVAAGILVLAAAVSLLPRVPWVGRRTADELARAPMLDILVAAFTWVPWVIGAVQEGWLGLACAIAGQIGGYMAWVAWHEWRHREAVRGPTIFRAINRYVGKVKNHAALWVTMIALPGFWFIRIQQIFTYPLLVWLLKFPRYRHSEWINVTRQKFDGLVGHDLLWCLYCDWMTGVYALGAEMLRNVESFWCPIRFYSGKKCANCRTDFPDLDNGWVGNDGTMTQVVQTLDEHYADGRREWFGHPARLTVKGKPVE